MMKLKDVLKKEFGNNPKVIDMILSGKLKYSKMTLEQSNNAYIEGWLLLYEYKIDLNNTYKKVMDHTDGLGIYYSFRDKKNRLYYTRILKGFVVKIGPAVNNDVVDGNILTQKNRKIVDEKVLNTHISNLLKYVNKYKPEKLYLNIETSDLHGEGRKRLFIGIAGKMHDFVKDVKVDGDEITIYLKYNEEGA